LPLINQEARSRSSMGGTDSRMRAPVRGSHGTMLVNGR